MPLSLPCRRVSQSPRWICAVILLGYVASNSGVAIPVPVRQVKSGEQFPCANSPCGCNTAEQCWRSCCCHTLQERIAWARARGIQPPAFVLAAFDQEQAAAHAAEENAEAKPFTTARSASCAHCRTHQSVQSLVRSPRPTLSRCCSVKHSRKPLAAVIVVNSLKCRGLTSSPSVAVVPVIVDTTSYRRTALACIAWLGPPESLSVSSLSFLPEVPPPRRV